ncbi:DDE-type integrase/transposase/recombinase [Candidatus Micrarchaeota archaeon]|nr:DDE-type integrase/transposase/recombinase [Candidatus Micrarchaeota archaeon]MBU1887044.1 DDE-type integrase/transposase/recombinase [Candidatus Micrarchaeota archaeon]
MGYNNEIVNIAVRMVLEDHHPIREVARLLRIGRAAIGRWMKRIKAGMPTHFSSAPKQVHNRTGENILKRIRRMLEKGEGTIKAWSDAGKKVCIRTVQRWKGKWFSTVKKKVKPRRYERKKLFSLMHTDWGVKRINEGRRCCFTFYEDDSSRMLYATKAYKKADLDNTIDAFVNARSKTGFKAVLSDCGKVYQNTFIGLCKSNDVKSIHTRPFNPKCNGKAEAVVKKIKTFMSRYEIRDIEHANRLLRKFEWGYNRTPHSSLKYKTPLEVYEAKRTSGAICGVA